MIVADTFDSGCLAREVKLFLALVVVWVLFAVNLVRQNCGLYCGACNPSLDLSYTALTTYVVFFVIYLIMDGLATNDEDDPADGRFAEESCSKFSILLNSSTIAQRYTLGPFFAFLNITDCIFRVCSASLLPPDFWRRNVPFLQRTANPPDNPPTRPFATTDVEEIEMQSLSGGRGSAELSPIRRSPSSSPSRRRAVAGLGSGSSPSTPTASGLFTDMT